jgi:hypothetical protein
LRTAHLAERLQNWMSLFVKVHVHAELSYLKQDLPELVLDQKVYGERVAVNVTRSRNQMSRHYEPLITRASECA